MKHITLWLGLALFLAAPAAAWDGFDADSADLVEIIPDSLPRPGQKIEVRNYDTDKTSSVIVKSVTRNTKTIEVVIINEEGLPRTLVMEGR